VWKEHEPPGNPLEPSRHLIRILAVLKRHETVSRWAIFLGRSSPSFKQRTFLNIVAYRRGILNFALPLDDLHLYLGFQTDVFDGVLEKLTNAMSSTKSRHVRFVKDLRRVPQAERQSKVMIPHSDLLHRWGKHKSFARSILHFLTVYLPDVAYDSTL
jgi:hypothetical protein